MNAFSPLPPDAAGARGFTSAVMARAAGTGSGAKSFAVLQCGPEFAWVAPLDLILARLSRAMMAGIAIVEMC